MKPQSAFVVYQENSKHKRKEKLKSQFRVSESSGKIQKKKKNKKLPIKTLGKQNLKAIQDEEAPQLVNFKKKTDKKENPNQKNKEKPSKSSEISKKKTKITEKNESPAKKKSKVLKKKSKETKSKPVNLLTNGHNGTFSDDEEPEFRLSDQVEVLSTEDEEAIEYDSEDEDACINGQRVFGWMIFPTDVAKFFKNHWEKKPLHVSRQSPKYYCHILNSKTLDQMLRKNVLLFEKNLDVVSYNNGVRETLNPHDGRAMPSAVWDFYSNGCSVRIKNPQTFNHKLHILLNDLQEFFGSFVGVNLYLTPSGSQGFAPHWDDIEAFVIQLEGRKHWKLYNPKSKHDVLSRFSSHNLSENELGEQIMEVTLNPGDMLYFPRGIVHQAKTDEDSHSLHLTISVYQRTSYADLLEHALPIALKEVAHSNKEFREGLPLQYLKHLGEVNKDKQSEIKKFVMDKMETLMNKLFSAEAVEKAADIMGKRLMQESLPPVPYTAEKLRTSHLDGDTLVDGVVINRVEFELDTKVRLIRHHCVRLVIDDNDPSDKLKLFYCTQNSLEYSEEGQKHLSLEAEHVSIIKQLQLSYPHYIAIEEFEEPQKALELISDLWELGIIVTKQPLPVID